MFKEHFRGRNPASFHINPLVKSFIISEAFLWSAWNFFAPIFAIFVASTIKGGSIEFAAMAFSAHLIARVLTELVESKYLPKASERQKIKITIIGLLLMSFSYVGLAFSSEIFHVFLFYSFAGIGIGIASPAKNSLFSTHLDKNKESSEWGLYDAVVLIGAALATALGGFIAAQYGFKTLFILSAVLNLIGILPYALFRISK